MYGFHLQARSGHTNPPRNTRIREPKYSHQQQVNAARGYYISKLFYLKARTRMLQATTPAAPNNHVLHPALNLGAA